jgi:hypothetical protein
MKIYTLAGVHYVPVVTAGGIVLRKAGKRSPAPGQLGLFDAQHQEGETRTNQAGHQEVLQGGRWHLAGSQGATPAAPATPAAQAQPQAQQQAPTMEGLHALHQQVSQGVQGEQQDPLAGINPKAALNSASPEAGQFVNFLKQSGDPDMLVELLTEWPVSSCRRQAKEWESAVKAYDSFGVQSIEDICTPDDLAEVFGGKSPPPKDAYAKAVYNAVAGAAQNFSELSQHGINPLEEAWGYAYEDKSSLQALRKDFAGDLNSATDQASKRKAELALGLLDSVINALPAIEKATSQMESFHEKLPENFFDADSKQDAIAQQRIYMLATSPTARKIAKVLAQDDAAFDSIMNRAGSQQSNTIAILRQVPRS